MKCSLFVGAGGGVGGRGMELGKDMGRQGNMGTWVRKRWADWKPTHTFLRGLNAF